MAIRNFAKFSLVVYNGRIYTFNGFTRCMKYCALVDVASHSKTYVPADTLVDLNS